MATTAVFNALKDIDNELKRSKLFACATCSLCSIGAYDVPPEENLIDGRMMRGMNGFVKGRFACSGGYRQLTTEESSNHFCPNGDRNRQNICANCEHAEPKIVRMMPKVPLKDMNVHERYNNEGCKISRQVFICKNVQSPEHFHNKYLSRYLSCDKFEPRDNNENNGQQRQGIYKR